MADLIPLRHKISWIFLLQCIIDFLFGILCPIDKSLRMRPRINRLIPDRRNPAAAVRIAERVVFIRNSGIQKTDHYPAPHQIQIAL